MNFDYLYFCPKCNLFAEKIYNGTCNYCRKDTLIPTNLSYEEYKAIKKKHELGKFQKELVEKYYAENPDKRPKPQPKPKCPTCGTENIRKISDAERGANAFMFGLMGNKRKCQFECINPNCKYKW